MDIFDKQKMQNPIIEIQKAEEEAKKVISKAEEKRDQILSDAKKEADELIQKAEELAKDEMRARLTEKKKACANDFAKMTEKGKADANNANSTAEGNLQNAVKEVVSYTKSTFLSK